jgi:hypothetical protein
MWTTPSRILPCRPNRKSWIVRTRGYAHRSHRLLANHDLDALKAVNDITLANYIPARSLSEADKSARDPDASVCGEEVGVGAHVNKRALTFCNAARFDRSIA